MTPELLQTYALPIGLGLALVIMLAVSPLRQALFASFKSGHQQGEAARRALTGVQAHKPAEPSTANTRAPRPQSFGRKR